MEPTLHNILSGSTQARAYALRHLGVGTPEHDTAWTRFADEVQQAEDELIYRLETPSLTGIFHALDCAVGWADAFEKGHYAEAARRFIQDLHQAGLELQITCRMDTSYQSSPQKIPTDAGLYDGVSCLTRALAYARFISIRQSEYAPALKRFQEEALRIQKDFIEKVSPSQISEEEAKLRGLNLTSNPKRGIR
ncbi:MAG: hypothetical protein ABIU05_17255 [Nitrospirales bacterium]